MFIRDFFSFLIAKAERDSDTERIHRLELEKYSKEQENYSKA